MIVECVEKKAVPFIRRADIKHIQTIRGLLIGAVQSAAAAAALVSDRQCRPIGEESTPINTEALSVALRRKVGRADQAEGSGTVVIVVVRGRAGKMAAREEVRRCGNAAGIRQRLV